MSVSALMNHANTHFPVFDILCITFHLYMMYAPRGVEMCNIDLVMNRHYNSVYYILLWLARTYYLSGVASNCIIFYIIIQLSLIDMYIFVTV